MKKQLFLALLLGLFCLGNVSLGAALNDLDSGEEAMIQARQEVSFSLLLPEKYISEDDCLIMPLEISVIKDGKTFFSLQSKERNVLLPDLNLPNGTYFIIVGIGDYSIAEKIEW